MHIGETTITRFMADCGTPARILCIRQATTMRGGDGDDGGDGENHSFGRDSPASNCNNQYECIIYISHKRWNRTIFPLIGIMMHRMRRCIFFCFFFYWPLHGIGGEWRSVQLVQCRILLMGLQMREKKINANDWKIDLKTKRSYSRDQDVLYDIIW